MMWIDAMVKLPSHQQLMQVYYLNGSVMYGILNDRRPVIYYIETDVLRVAGHHQEGSNVDLVQNMNELRLCSVPDCWNTYKDYICKRMVEFSERRNQLREKDKWQRLVEMEWKDLSRQSHAVITDILQGSTHDTPVDWMPGHVLTEDDDDFEEIDVSLTFDSIILKMKALGLSEPIGFKLMAHIDGPHTIIATLTQIRSLMAILDAKLGKAEVRQLLKLANPGLIESKLALEVGHNHHGVSLSYDGCDYTIEEFLDTHIN